MKFPITKRAIVVFDLWGSSLSYILVSLQIFKKIILKSHFSPILYMLSSKIAKVGNTVKNQGIEVITHLQCSLFFYMFNELGELSGGSSCWAFICRFHLALPRWQWNQAENMSSTFIYYLQVPKYKQVIKKIKFFDKYFEIKIYLSKIPFRI